MTDSISQTRPSKSLLALALGSLILGLSACSSDAPEEVAGETTEATESGSVDSGAVEISPKEISDEEAAEDVVEITPMGASRKELLSKAKDRIPVRVTIDNFVRAETAFQFKRALATTGGVNQWAHFSQPTPLDSQNVIRMNRDTLYSFAVVDIRKGATVTVPETDGRYVNVMVVNEDHYINEVFNGEGSYEISIEDHETPYVFLIARVMADPNDPEDIEAANAIQNALTLEAESSKPYSPPKFDQESYDALYEKLLTLAQGVEDTWYTFGTREEVNDVRHLLGTAFGWGGLPVQEAFYINFGEPRDAGEYELTVKDVPVDGFWSISIYNEDGFFEENEFNSYSLNNVTATPNEDGSFTIHFGTDPKDRDNFLYVTDGWNYVVRLYQPQKPILNGEWSFPEPVAAAEAE